MKDCQILLLIKAGTARESGHRSGYFWNVWERVLISAVVVE